MTYWDADNAPSLSEVNREEWEATEAPLPRWFRDAGLKITRPHRNASGGPSESVSCPEHGGFHSHGTRSAVLYWADKHVQGEHLG